MTPFFDKLAAEFTSHTRHQRYHQPQPKEAPTMAFLDDIRAEVSRAVTWTEDEIRAHLPTVAALADHAEAVAASAPAQAVLGAVLSPEDESLVLAFVQRLDQRVHNMAAGEQPEPQPAA